MSRDAETPSEPAEEAPAGASRPDAVKATGAWLESLLTRRGLKRIKQNYGLLGLVVFGLGIVADINEIFGPMTELMTVFAALPVAALIAAAYWRPHWRERLALPLALFAALFLVGVLMLFGQRAFANDDTGSLVGTAVPPIGAWQEEILARLDRIEEGVTETNERLERIEDRLDGCPDGLDASVCGLLRLQESGGLSETGSAQLEALLLARLSLTETGRDDAEGSSSAVLAILDRTDDTARRATRLLLTGEIDAAFDLLEAEARSAERPFESWRDLGMLARFARPSRSIAAFEQAMALDPVDFTTRYQLGNLYVLAGRLDEGSALIETLEQYANDETDRVRALSQRSRLLSRQGENRAAFTVAIEAVRLAAGFGGAAELDPADAFMRALVNLDAANYAAQIGIYTEQARFAEDAREVIAAMIEAGAHPLAPALDVYALSQIASAALSQGELDSARTLAEEALDAARRLIADSAQGPNTSMAADSLHLLAQIDFIEGDRESGLERVSAAIDLQRGPAADPAAADERRRLAAFLRLRADHLDDGVELEAALADYQEAVDLMRPLADLQGQDAAALDVFVEMLEGGAQLQGRLGRPEEAAEGLREARIVNARLIARYPESEALERRERRLATQIRDFERRAQLSE